MTTGTDTNICRPLTLWRAPSRPAIATRVAIAGDFLPAGKLPTAAFTSWRDLAQPLLPHFAGVDTTFLNLECALDVEGLASRPLNGIGQIVSAQPNVLDYLGAIKCRAISFANNHAYDFGPVGVARTRAALESRGFTPIGTGRDLSNPPQIYVWDGPGRVRVGLWTAARASRELASRNAAGVEPATIDRASQALALMKQQGVTFSIALLHAGTIRTSRPAPEDVALLRRLAKCGFCLVAASHSHRIAAFESVVARAGSPSFCFYGLGSIVSGYIASEEEREGLIVTVGFDEAGRLAEIGVQPVFLPDSGIGEMPAPWIATRILDRFRLLSSEISDGSYKSAFYRDVSRGIVNLYLRDVHASLRQSGLRGLVRKAARVRLYHVKRLMHRVLAT
ncbi:MAG TPA: CapA family protein [Candidatus Acidoferrales bacterium]